MKFLKYKNSLLIKKLSYLVILGCCLSIVAVEFFILIDIHLRSYLLNSKQIKD